MVVATILVAGALVLPYNYAMARRKTSNVKYKLRPRQASRLVLRKKLNNK